MSRAPGSPEPDSTGNVAASKPSIPDYELLRIVGRGSYGDVWLARSVTGAWRAVKVVWRERFVNAEPFECEFRGLKEFAEISLGESSQMALLHVGRNDAAGFFYYVMELADDAERGRAIDPAVYVPLTLAEMRTRRGRIPANECARFGAEVAGVLASLHRRGFVHRDVKPSNIILVSGVPKLADVGLVAAAATAQTFVGTEGYVPPEGPGAPSADAFALGKLLYELSTGHDRQEFPKLPADLARFPDRAVLLELNEIILRACGPTKAERYQDGAAILADLAALNAGASLRTRRLTAFLLRAAALVGVVAALSFGGWYWIRRSVPPPAPIVAGVSRNAVAVLPFTAANGDASQEYFSDGITDEILHALERERDLRVTGSRSSFSFKDRQISSMEIAKVLRVAQLVEGTLRRAGTRVRVDVRLTRAGDGVSENLGSFEREISDVYGLVNDVAWAVTEKLLHRVTMPALKPATTNVEAFEAFLRGRARQVRTVDRSPTAAAQIAEAVMHFERAVELDPNFAVAWARLAQARHYAGGIQNVRGPSPDSPLATVERALALRPDLALAWSVRGFIVGVGHAESAAGLRDLFRAEELECPNAETRLMRFLVTWFAGESRGLLPLAREALAANPENVDRMVVVQGAMGYLGDYAEADRLYQQTNSLVARIQLRQNWRGSEAALRLAQRLPDETNVIETRARLLVALGRVSEAVKTIETLKTEPTWELYADIGNAERARELAQVALPAIRKRYQDWGDVVLTDTENTRRDIARALLVAAEIAAGNRAAALTLLHDWRRDTEKRTPNRRSGGVSVRLPRFYAQLGEPEIALSLLRQGIADGRNPGYELRDVLSYAAMQEHPGFRELRQQAEAWAESQPDPPDDSVVTSPSIQ
jgi:TolB-like protein/tetratricopeptide (TPR) repeat protein